MTLAMVQFGVAIVMALLLSWTGLLIAVALTLPAQTNRAEQALDSDGRHCFARGLLGLLITVIGVLFVRLPEPLVKLVGIVSLLAIGGVISVGAAGIARLMGRRIGEMSGERNSFGLLVRGGVTYSAAMLFPLVGWYLFLPISTIFALGAGMHAFAPRRNRSASPTSHGDSQLQGAV